MASRLRLWASFGAMLLLAAQGRAADLLVPGDYADPYLAYAAANDGDVIRITDSGVYTAAGLSIAKQISIVADAGQTPTLRISGATFAITFGAGSAGAQIGSLSGGRITIDGNHNSRIAFRFAAGGGSLLTFENLLVHNLADPGVGTDWFIYADGGGDAAFRNVTLDADPNKGANGDYIAQFLGAFQHTITFEDCTISHPRAGAAGFLLSNGFGSLSFDNCTLNVGRSIVYIENSVGGNWEINLTNSWARNGYIAGSAGAIVLGGTNAANAVLNITTSSLVTAGTAIFAGASALGSTVTIDHSDLITTSTTVSAYAIDFQSTGTLSLTNSNLIAPTATGGKALRWVQGSPAVHGDYNNVVAANTYINWLPGANDVVPGLDPQYYDQPGGNFGYAEFNLWNASSTSTPVGASTNFVTSEYYVPVELSGFSVE